jgi:hypothetical protein
VRNASLGIALGGSTSIECDLPPVPLITESGEPNMNNAASYCAITGEIVKIADGYPRCGDLDFSGKQEFDVAMILDQIGGSTAAGKDQTVSLENLPIRAEASDLQQPPGSPGGC